jgi:hypothetical protein
MGIARVWRNPLNYKQKVFVDPFFYPSATPSPGVGPIPAGYVMDVATDDSWNNAITPPPTLQPVFSGGWPAYSDAPQQLGFTAGYK